ncbi:tRNA (adenosine(37)-N6)-dimethylallyltransferase MiaA [Parasphaerochaeta coccoides]|uniref:tRNA dimethylallyltransferase n=1 Tax=Parasphaerochaeta coccoides (strain ATCC BAA-1237 / DSM 17374 / SPN1) TaxID=760011 RepID=F4GIJ4_PARC1|nr:tRNA (adenosine(37)-N6)-dimethylallyltransferase MiaA [Parasphaerochaeta coccoides]AEC02128.1 tRNA dimethylallyltransferase [Parasphaerochaeta coccoides DSM 17374]
MATETAYFSRIIFLFGPTGVGKTGLLPRLFRHGYGVINADSIQVYRHLDIGSAKPSRQLQSLVPHELLDVAEPWEQFSVGTFVRMADEAVIRIASKGDIPVLTGGTAYYFKHFLHGLSEAPPADSRIRNEIAGIKEEKGLAWCHQWLAEVDPVSAVRIHPSDTQRILRALEVWQSTGRPLSSFTVPDGPRHGMKPLIIGLERERDDLKERIAQRVKAMFEEGLEDEMRRLLMMGAVSSWPSMQGIGYREFFQAMRGGEMTHSGIATQIARNCHLYAKRQYTFFRSFADVTWMHPDDDTGIKHLVDVYLGI